MVLYNPHYSIMKERLKKMRVKYLIFLGLIFIFFMIIKYTLPAYIPENNFQTDFARIEKAVINKEITIQKQQEIIDFIKNHQDGAQKISIA